MLRTDTINLEEVYCPVLKTVMRHPMRINGGKVFELRALVIIARERLICPLTRARIISAEYDEVIKHQLDTEYHQHPEREEDYRKEDLLLELNSLIRTGHVKSLLFSIATVLYKLHETMALLPDFLWIELCRQVNELSQRINWANYQELFVRFVATQENNNSSDRFHLFNSYPAIFDATTIQAVPQPGLNTLILTTSILLFADSDIAKNFGSLGVFFACISMLQALYITTRWLPTAYSNLRENSLFGRYNGRNERLPQVELLEEDNRPNIQLNPS